MRNVIIAASRSATTIGIITFNRTDNGNVVPRTIISGRNTGLAHFRQVAVDPESGRIFLAQQSMQEKQLEPYRADQPRTEEEFTKAQRVIERTGRSGLHRRLGHQRQRRHPAARADPGAGEPPDLAGRQSRSTRSAE